MGTYTPIVFVNDEPPDVDATNLNYTQTGIKDAHDEIEVIDDRVTALETLPSGPHTVTAVPAGPYTQGQQLSVITQGPYPTSPPYSYDYIGLVYDTTMVQFVAPVPVVATLLGQDERTTSSTSDDHDLYSSSTLIRRIVMPFKSLDNAGLTYECKVTAEIKSSDSNAVRFACCAWTSDAGGVFGTVAHFGSYSPNVTGTTYKTLGTGWQKFTGFAVKDYVAFSFACRSGNGTSAATIKNVQLHIREVSK